MAVLYLLLEALWVREVGPNSFVGENGHAMRRPRPEGPSAPPPPLMHSAIRTQDVNVSCTLRRTQRLQFAVLCSSNSSNCLNRQGRGRMLQQ